MPDLDTELARLRDDMRGELQVPSFDQVVARHRQRVVRRRMQVGAVAAVLAVSVAIPMLRNQMASHPAPPAAPTPSQPAVPTGPFLHDLRFADDDHGYALRTTCKNGRLPCTEELLTTEDGGAHWDSRQLQRPADAPSWAGGVLTMLGPDEIAIDWGLSAHTSQMSQIRRTHSTDGGRTWQSVAMPDIVTATIPEIPDQAKLGSACARLIGGGKKCAERGFAVIQPGSGESALLANRPPLTAMLAGDVPTADGQWWVVGRDPRTGTWGLAVSDDDGRTWTTNVLDFRESVDPYGWSVVSANGILYATAIGPGPNTSNALLGIFRSTDGGHTWERTWRPADGKVPGRVFHSTVAATDGTLTINTTDGKTYLSGDGGRTFTETKRRFGDYAIWAGNSYVSYVALPTNSSWKTQTSEDGIHWRTIKVD